MKMQQGKVQLVSIIDKEANDPKKENAIIVKPQLNEILCNKAKFLRIRRAKERKAEMEIKKG